MQFLHFCMMRIPAQAMDIPAIFRSKCGQAASKSARETPREVGLSQISIRGDG